MLTYTAMWRQTLWVIFLSVLWLPVSGQALAQSVPARPVGSTVNVTLRGEKPKLRFAVLPEYPPEDSEVDPPIKVCEGDCSVALPPGRYRLEVSSPTDRDVRAGTTVFTIDRDSEVTVHPASEKRLSEGRAGVVAGMTIAGVATFVMVIGAFINRAAECLENCQNDTMENRNRHLLWLVGITGGVVIFGGLAAAVGWTTLARNRQPTLKVAPAQRKSTAFGNLRLGPLRMPAGWGLGAAMTF